MEEKKQSVEVFYGGEGFFTRAPQFKVNIRGSGNGRKASRNHTLRPGPGSFGSKLMDLDGLKVRNFQPKI